MPESAPNSVSITRWAASSRAESVAVPDIASTIRVVSGDTILKAFPGTDRRVPASLGLACRHVTGAIKGHNQPVAENLGPLRGGQVELAEIELAV